MLAKVAAARDAIQEDQTPASPEPLATVAPRKPVIDGGKELYHRQRREGIARLKANRSAEATSRDVDVRAAVADGDAAADAADRRSF